HSLLNRMYAVADGRLRQHRHKGIAIPLNDVAQISALPDNFAFEHFSSYPGCIPGNLNDDGGVAVTLVQQYRQADHALGAHQTYFQKRSLIRRNKRGSYGIMWKPDILDGFIEFGQPLFLLNLNLLHVLG